MRQYLPDFPDARMLKNKLIYFAFIFFILFVSFKFRSRNYWSYPPSYETFDELAFVWAGQSLVKTGIPVSWSYHPYYALGIPEKAKLYLEGFRIIIPGKDLSNLPKPLLLTQEIDVQGYRSHFNFVTPDLEQPPLGSILISISSLISKVNSFATNIKIIRLPFVWLGVFSVFLVWYLTKILFGRTISLISLSVYATVPTVIFASRLALPENILAAFFLIEVIFLELYRQKKKNYLLILSLIVSFLSPLVKLFGMAIPLTGFLYFWVVLKDKKKSLLFILSALFSLISYVIYGFSIDKKTFLLGINYQSQRFFSGPNVFLTKVLIPRVTKIFLDGWIFFAWISFLTLSFRKEFSKYLALILPIVSYLFILILFGGEDYGWYRFPLYPFLIISSAAVLYETIRERKVLPFLVFLVTAVFSSIYWGLNVYDWSPYLNCFRLGFILILGILLFWKKIVPFFMIIILILSLYLNTRAINYSQGIWEKLGDENSLIIGR